MKLRNLLYTLLIVSVTSCTNKLTEVYYRQAVDIAYIEICNNWTWFAEFRVKRLTEKLGVNGYYFIDGKFYIPIDYSHVNKGVLKNKHRNNIKYEIDGSIQRFKWGV